MRSRRPPSSPGSGRVAREGQDAGLAPLSPDEVRLQDPARRVLLLGLLRRERRGVANIGFESVLVLLLYVGGFAFLGFG